MQAIDIISLLKENEQKFTISDVNGSYYLIDANKLRFWVSFDPDLIFLVQLQQDDQAFTWEHPDLTNRVTDGRFENEIKVETFDDMVDLIDGYIASLFSTIELDITDEEFITIAKAAHHKNVTFNQYIVMAVKATLRELGHEV
jgi:hypothetical protein